ncbi:DNA-processing protein DprA [Sagittula sp. SSi028]|uniref:DNA-processing protein DprA n=1 Tax=Sagittula sp. SSi028 TaxID=3400636 RepID=UPI003AF639A9
MRDDSYSSTHPPLPPTTEDICVDWLRLLRSRRVGPTTFWRLMAEHGDARTALAALPEVARTAGVKDYEACPQSVAEAELRAGQQAGARLIARGAAEYPADLAELPDAPPLLWVRGDAGILNRPMIALVGARNASSLGGRMARSLGRDLAANGYCIVSGLARGIDTAAHEAALGQGTVAVFAGGVDVIYPSENAKLAEDIVEQGGALLSEQPIGMQPMARHFPTRNRIVSGMSRAVVVVEAAAKSGSLITARGALDQGREVLAVPGHPLDARAAGCNLLIRDGARLVRHADDVLEALPPLEGPDQGSFDLPPPAPTAMEEPAPRPNLRRVASLHRQILDRLGPSPTAEDQLMRDIGSGAGDIASVLTELELEGQVKRQPGGFLSLITKR